jgi:hypothetical protein
VLSWDRYFAATVAIPFPHRLQDRCTRPVGALLGGLIATAIGLRPALWIATLGGIAGFFLLLPTPVPRYRLPTSAPSGESAGERSACA